MRSEAVDSHEGVPNNREPAATKDFAVSCVADTKGAESPATPIEVALDTHAVTSMSRGEQKGRKCIENKASVTMTTTQMQIEQRRERHWRRMVHGELRDRLISAMIEQLRRVTGDSDVRHLRFCASRYESFVWKQSVNQVQYKQKLEHRIESLSRQPSYIENGGVEVTVRLIEGHRLNLSRSSDPVLGPCPYSHDVSEQNHSMTGYPTSPTQLRYSEQLNCCQYNSKRGEKRKVATDALDAAAIGRDKLYFEKLRVMRLQYRDEVALVFRELCRVNSVIQHSTTLRCHESNNLGDFLANLKKIIYLLEQQPNESCGMISARKRTVEYLDIVDSHIQRKVLPILYRLRHTYSTILRPIVLNYMKNSSRYHRRF
ncbi:uncharacterized protein PHALS_06959 [Plasmopara halstedii]|uniref:Mediator complex subunit 15 KIX domain-containing protein n=1 Tax=Plasmopara halstedii TaxID=4781 RepID=A0A0P1B4V0_PLAHL|nr:uncharacterized protein PHALS_06959 [Plasmopara halstedii]CEG49182.1 hypothetical protein PHALS_06959 [Plasmopara halstedii]|eukprot:XP_024585551.1 hypothetical protein PHALS_06959 [Plasmopara halstedii]